MGEIFRQKLIKSRLFGNQRSLGVRHLDLVDGIAIYFLFLEHASGELNGRAFVGFRRQCKDVFHDLYQEGDNQLLVILANKALNEDK